MSDVLIRGIDAKVLKRLKVRAKRNGRSLQGEAKMILQRAAGMTGHEVVLATEKWRKKFKGSKFGDSAAMVREDRER